MTKQTETERQIMIRAMGGRLTANDDHFIDQVMDGVEKICQSRADLTRAGSRADVWDEAIDLVKEKREKWEGDDFNPADPPDTRETHFAVAADVIIEALEAAKSASLATRELPAEPSSVAQAVKARLIAKVRAMADVYDRKQQLQANRDWSLHQHFMAEKNAALEIAAELEKLPTGPQENQEDGQ